MILGLVGKKRSGKDTFAARLTSRHEFTRYAFADPLKEVALDLDPFITPGSRLSDLFSYLRFAFPEDDPWERAKEDREVRRLLQELGVAVRNRVGEDVWVSATMEKVLRDPGLTVITDVRFPNEAEAITSHGGKLVRVIRPGLDASDKHSSETALDQWPTDYEVLNDTSIEGLNSHADLIVHGLRLASYGFRY